MRRRDFLKSGVSGALGMALPQNPGASPALPALDPAGIEAKLERIDRRMVWFNQIDPLAGSTPRNEVEAKVLAQRRHLGRQALRSFYFNGAFIGFDHAEQAHPGVQERMGRMVQEMDFAVDHTATYLEDLKPQERKSIQNELRRQPDLGPSLGDMFHRVAAEDGFGLLRRLDMRLAFADITRRLENQNPSVLIDPYVSKVRRLQASAAERPEAVASAKAGAFWEAEQRLAAHVGEWDRIYATRPRTDRARIESIYPGDGMLMAQAEPTTNDPNPSRVMTPVDAAPPASSVPPVDDWDPSAPWHPRQLPSDGEPSPYAGPPPPRKGLSTLTAGAITMGVGAVSTGVGAIFLAVGGSSSSLFVPGLIFGVTVGPILLAVGLVILIVGTVIYLASK
jgi:hypothetical protein